MFDENTQNCNRKNYRVGNLTLVKGPLGPSHTWTLETRDYFDGRFLGVFRGYGVYARPLSQVKEPSRFLAVSAA